jgi:hypothetical protein
MSPSQTGVLAPAPPLARCIGFQVSPGADPQPEVLGLAEPTLEDELVDLLNAPYSVQSTERGGVFEHWMPAVTPEESMEQAAVVAPMIA